RLKESREAQAAGAKAMLKEGHAREEEAVARLQLLETSSARDVALAKYEAQCAMSKLEEASAEMTELKAKCEGMYRAQTEGG
ncbi:unnamed protein product, partial [Ectocarpus sp. 12 AP-2014]